MPGSRIGFRIARVAAIAAAMVGMIAIGGALAQQRPPLVDRLVAQLNRPLSPDEDRAVRALSAGAAAEIVPVHARYLQDVAALSGQPEAAIAALAPALGDPPPVPVLVPQLERRMDRPLTLVEHRRLIEADQASRRALIAVRDRLARRLAALLDVDYARLRSLLRESDLAA